MPRGMMDAWLKDDNLGFLHRLEGRVGTDDWRPPMHAGTIEN